MIKIPFAKETPLSSKREIVLSRIMAAFGWRSFKAFYSLITRKHVLFSCNVQLYYEDKKHINTAKMICRDGQNITDIDSCLLCSPSCMCMFIVRLSFMKGKSDKEIDCYDENCKFVGPRFQGEDRLNSIMMRFEKLIDARIQP